MTSQDLPPQDTYRKGAPFETITEFVIAVFANEYFYDGDTLQAAFLGRRWSLQNINDNLRGLSHAIKIEARDD